jgi:hypothetical protein
MFIFELSMLIIQVDFIVKIPDMCTVYLEEVDPLHYISTPFLRPPFSDSVWWVSLCSLHMYIYSLLLSLPLTILSFPLPPFWLLPTNQEMIFKSFRFLGKIVGKSLSF